MNQLRSVARVVLGLFLLFAGSAHVFWARTECRAQVPAWFPGSEDLVVVASGVVEIGLGLALIFVTGRRELVGVVVALFFVAVFPGNIAQYVEGVDAFGLDTDRARLVRLFFQPLLVLWALAATGVWPRERDR